MPYATSDDLLLRISATDLATLADDDASGTADALILNDALTESSAFIDQQLAARYVTPVADPPSILRTWCLDLALEMLHARRTAEMPAAITDAADLARRALQAIHDGLAGLAGAMPHADDFASDNTRLDDEAAFTRETLEPY
jgi:phage gp36-like protein